MAKRMRLIADEDYERMRFKQTPTISKITDHYFHDTDQQATSVLSNPDIPDDIKIQLYGSVMNSVKEQLQNVLFRPSLLQVVKKEIDKSKNVPNVIDNNSKPVVTEQNKTEEQKEQEQDEQGDRVRLNLI